MSYAKKAIMKIAKREPREPKGSEIRRNKPTMHDGNKETPMHDGNKPTHHTHMYGEIPGPKDKPHVLKKLGC